jgi:hypothetical protein
MFDVKKHLIKVQGGRQYLPVAARLIWFRTEHPDWGIETKAITIDVEKSYAIFESTVYDADGKLMAKGTKMENIRGFGDWLEKAETGAIGRALAVCGYGTQFAPDLDESHNGSDIETDQYTGGYRGNGDRYEPRPSYPNSNNNVRNDGLALVTEDTVQSHAGGRKTDGQDDNCQECSAVLKPSQLSLSLRKFGAALCPDCQKKRKPVQAA